MKRIEKIEYDDFIRKAKLSPKKFRLAYAFDNEIGGEIKDKEAANLNAYLILQGWKTATVISSVEEFEGMPQKFEVDGKYDLVLDGLGNPVAAIQTTKVEYVRFCDVTEDFARKDGESETLEQWQAMMRAFLEQYGAFSPEMKIVCIEFRRLYPKD